MSGVNPSGATTSGGGGACSGSSSGSGAGSGASTGPCGACKFLRRKCVSGCIFAPYFDAEQGAGHFAAVHKVFGASNVSKLLMQIPAHRRLDAVVTICYEAQARLRDPVYGCVAHIFALQQQVCLLKWLGFEFVNFFLLLFELLFSKSLFACVIFLSIKTCLDLYLSLSVWGN